MKNRRRSGQSLIEVIIATLLVAMITIPIMAAAFSGHQLTAKASNKLQAAADVRRLSEALKAYVVACPYKALPSACTPDATYPGPAGGINSWAVPGDTSGKNAFDEGPHSLDKATWLPGLDAPQYNGAISYNVTIRQTPQGREPTVTFNVSWTDQ